MGGTGQFDQRFTFEFNSLNLAHTSAPRGVVSSGPLKIVEIDFLKIELIYFVSDTIFYFVLLK